ncbi:nuclease [Mycoplasmopsis pullorum]|uniref:thermonuclease family protein n=1 Tax=Mycoplasmopsis pullorum TaxID=48003 RepID=UPI001117B67C|nr:thermonuclease family protein [Mycoplasmopsis pullorum]TNK82102.1 nuclease [Mycoplasmopsis pullorum]TNK83214.1 nuclease [Mycoplasmopsis pullorum]TNK84350.1 nuclease [Mycoplasmopsis pullorum]TNK85439.1 nuclease [Mycoplasmopsis pullorum]TNK86186.1 nuclease [Mycoplasmopsis pullorum]
MTKKSFFTKLKWLTLFATPLALITVSSACVQKQEPKRAVYYLRYVYDGDTIAVSPNSPIEKDFIKVRFFGIDTPETKKENKAEALAKYEDHYARLATQGLKEMLYGSEKVTLEEFGKDKYGRTLAIVYNSKGENLNYEMVKQGLARAYYISTNPKSLFYTNTPTKVKIYNDLKKLQAEAKEKQINIWTKQNIQDVFHAFTELAE